MHLKEYAKSKTSIGARKLGKSTNSFQSSLILRPSDQDTWSNKKLFTFPFHLKFKTQCFKPKDCKFWKLLLFEILKI